MSETINVSGEDRQTLQTTPVETVVSNIGLVDKIPIFNYLVTSERVGWYRTIMRFFLAQHREFYKYQLTAHDIWEAVRREFDPIYTIEKCQTDLRVLEEWGNLLTTYDASRHTTIQSFRAPALLYQATPLAIAVETFLQEQRRAGSSLGALRQGDLPRLWALIGRLDELLLAVQSSGMAPSQNSSVELADQWRQVFELFSTMAREAAQYLANMVTEARRPHTGLEAYQSYKRAVVEYVTNFGQALSQYSVSFRELMQKWYDDTRAKLLIDAIAAHLEPPTLAPERRQAPVQLLREAGNQVNALIGWFAVGANADTFRRAATAEVEKVVRRAEQFAAAARPNANYAVDLDRLSRRLLEAVDVEEARQLTLVAFGHGLPAHLPESLAGPSGNTGLSPSWHEAPSVTPLLHNLGRLKSDKTVEMAISNNRAAQETLTLLRLRERQEERERFTSLFASGSLDVGEIILKSIGERTALLAIIRGCLRDSKFQYRALDAALIVLVNPRETRYGLLRAPDGALLLPRYRLVKIEG